MGSPNLIGFYRDGAYRRRVINYSSGESTGTRNILPEESGTLFFVSPVSTAHFSLPKISSFALGLEYEFYLSTQDAANDVNIVSTLDSSAAIHIAGVSSASSLTTASAIAPASTLGDHAVRLVAVSSVKWLAMPALGIASESSGAAILGENIAGGWAAGTTQA